MIENITNPVDDLLTELNILTADEIRDKLVGANIRGKLGRSKECPLANYLSNKTGLIISIGIDDYLILDYKNGVLENVLGRGHLPNSVFDFVKNFDCGKYKELIDEYSI